MSEAVRVESGAEELHLMLTSAGWQFGARASVKKRLAHLGEMLATGRRLEVEKIRELQAQIELLRLLLADPFQFFSFGREAGEGHDDS